MLDMHLCLYDMYRFMMGLACIEIIGNALAAFTKHWACHGFLSCLVSLDELHILGGSSAVLHITKSGSWRQK